MAFENTIDKYGDEVTMARIIERTIDEYCDDSVTLIESNVFRNCDSLTKVDIPNVTEFRDSAFYQCKSLVEVNAPNLETVKGNVFRECTKPMNVYMPKLKSVGYYMFYQSGPAKVRFDSATKVDDSALCNCGNLTYVDLPSCVEIAQKAFFQSTKLVTLILRSNTMCVLKNVSAFDAGWEGGWTGIKRGDGYVYVPRALVDSYKAASNWSTYAAQFRALEDYTVDGTITGDLDESKI